MLLAAATAVIGVYVCVLYLLCSVMRHMRCSSTSCDFGVAPSNEAWQLYSILYG